MFTLTRKNGRIDRSAHRKVASLKGVAAHEFFGVVHDQTDCHCVVCRKGLSDALSCQNMIGPICSAKYYKNEPVVSDATMAKVIGMVAALDARISKDAGAIDADVIDFLLANKRSSRAFANILLAWGSVNAAKAARHKVVSITPIFRVLGYGLLADRLEKDRTPYRIEKAIVDHFNVVVPRAQWGEFTRKCGYVKVDFTKEHTNGGSIRLLSFENKDREIVWLLLKNLAHGKPLSIEGKGIVIIPKLTDADRKVLEARDTRPAPKVFRPTPITSSLFCRLEDDPKNAKVLRVFCTAPWIAPEANAFVDVLRGIRGRRWDGSDKCWTVPVTQRGKVITAAQDHLGLSI